MALRATVTEEPGLSALLSRDEPADDAELALALQAFKATNGVAKTPVETSLDAAIHRRADGTQQSLGFFETLRRWWVGELHEVVGREERMVPLDAYWLTLPEVPGAEASVAASEATSEEFYASVKILGVGGGPAFTVGLREKLGVTSPDPLKISSAAMGTFEKVEVRRDGKTVTTYPRLVAVDDNVKEYELTECAPPPASSLGNETGSQRFTVAARTATLRPELTIARGSVWEFGSEISLEQLGLKANSGMKTTLERELHYEHVLPGGHDYRAVRYAGFPAYLWSVDSA
jgi:hypothetical protein